MLILDLSEYPSKHDRLLSETKVRRYLVPWLPPLSSGEGGFFFLPSVWDKRQRDRQTCCRDTMRQRKSVLKFTHALNTETKSRMPNCLFRFKLQKCLNKSGIKKINHYDKWLIVLKSVGDDYLWPQLLVYIIDFVSSNFWEILNLRLYFILSNLWQSEEIYRNCLGEFITVCWQFSHIKTYRPK